MLIPSTDGQIEAMYNFLDTLRELELLNRPQKAAFLIVHSFPPQDLSKNESASG